MLVAIDARGYFTGGGVGRYTRNLLRELLSAGAIQSAGRADLVRSARFRLLISNQHRPGDLDLALDDQVEVVVSRAGWMNAVEEERYLPEEISGADVFHSLTGHWLPDRGTTVVTLLDLTPVVQPELVSPAARAAGRAGAETIARASHVIAISEATARDGRRVLGRRMPPSTVVHLAAARPFHPRVHPGNALWRYGLLARGFMLAVSALNPHKNLARLVDAYADARVAAPLLIAGAHREAAAGVEERIAARALTGRVRLLGRITDEDLAALYASCRAFIYPSLYEGFGLPLIEAMACGAAVVASDRSSIPEVAGDAALLVDPSSTPALAASIERLDRDTALRADLRRRAAARAKTFSWTRTARETVAVYAALAARADDTFTFGADRAGASCASAA